MPTRAGTRALISMLLLLAAVVPAMAAGPNGAQEKGAEDFLRAVAGGNAQAVAQELHPDELGKLRERLLVLLRAENMRSDNTYRSRLFGPGRSLADVESMTAVRFYVALAERLRLRAREYEKFKWLGVVPDDKIVYVVGKGIPPKDKGAVPVVVTVALMQYGAQWRAAIPSEVEAQIDDLLEGRTAGASNARAIASAAPAATQPLAPGISELLARAEAALAAGNCQQYYDEFMSPNFNRATSRSARKTLINACTNNESTRETMITTLRIVQELQPRYDLGGTRAVYDVSGQGLPYERFALERDKDMKWYIAE
ncbi:MAG TPA: hypothetical protein VFS13_18305 [Steroidobacteraceae bacterium]|nr:hypothetical protein [Steroidobacteraceae bacterium]